MILNCIVIQLISSLALDIACQSIEPGLTVDDSVWDTEYYIEDLPILKYEHDVTYDVMVTQIKDLKEILYNNFTKITDNDIPPPRGSQIRLNEELGTVEIVTRVGIYLFPDRIVKMDVEQQSLTLLLHEQLVWRDESLQWTRGSGVPIQDLYLNSSDIWIPPVYASGIVAEEEVVNPGLVYVFSDGLCFMGRSVLYTMPCSVNVEDFPFDMHTCFLTYKHWHNTHNRIFFSKLAQGQNNTRADRFQLNQQYPHLEWVGVSVSQELSGENNGRLEFSISLQRQSSFYAIVLIFPTVLLNVLSLVVFTLPINNTERENFSLTLTLTYFVLVMIIVDTSPPTGNQIPKLGLYVIMCTVIVVVTFGMSLILIELHEHKRAKKRKMSKFLFDFLKKCCCFEKCFRDYHQSSRGSYAINDELVDEDALLKPKTNNNNDNKMNMKREEFKWKLLAKVLNYVFFVLTLIAHILLPCLIYLV